jgi:hypothetical protein
MQKLTKENFNLLMLSKFFSVEAKNYLFTLLNNQSMTLTMKQLLALLRNAIKDKHIPDVNLMLEIISRSIRDQPVLDINDEIKSAVKEGMDFLKANSAMDLGLYEA